MRIWFSQNTRFVSEIVSCLVHPLGMPWKWVSRLSTNHYYHCLTESVDIRVKKFRDCFLVPWKWVSRLSTNQSLTRNNCLTEWIRWNSTKGFEWRLRPPESNHSVSVEHEWIIITIVSPNPLIFEQRFSSARIINTKPVSRQINWRLRVKTWSHRGMVSINVL